MGGVRVPGQKDNGRTNTKPNRHLAELTNVTKLAFRQTDIWQYRDHTRAMVENTNIEKKFCFTT